MKKLGNRWERNRREIGDSALFLTETNPGNFENVKGSKAKKNTETGEIWEKDLLHKDHYEVYKNKNNWEKGKRGRSVYGDGRTKEKF